MKIALLFIGFISANVFALPIHWTTNTVPSDIQARIESTVAERCEIYGRSLTESYSKVEEVRIDQGIVDTFYTVTLSASQKIDQYMYAEVDAVEVVVARYDFSNPLAGDPVQVESLKGLPSAAKCK